MNPNYSFFKNFYNLLSSMRFAVSLLTVLGIASILGTVLVQNQPYNNYIIKFGEYWFQFFEMLGLYDVYHSSWFLLILVFLVISTSLCVYRNTPSMIKEWKTFKEQATETSMQHFSHQADYQVAGDAAATKENVLKFLEVKGFTYKIKPQADGSEMIAAKAGTHQRLGYIFTHAAIVVICLGGVLDGNLPLKVQELLGNKKIEVRDVAESQIPAISRLGVDNNSFRGNMNLPEGKNSDVVFMRVRDGYFVQDLPFSIGLKKFHIEHYSTGQPKKFESEIVIHDPAVKEPIAARVSVNHPYIYKGVAIYQSDFRDGGTKLDFKVWDLMSRSDVAHEVKGEVFAQTLIGKGEDQLRVEYNDFRKFNIIDLTPEGGKAKPTNVGPNITYKIRDARGQAKEFVNYMRPLPVDDQRYFVTGVRNTAQEEFKYLRIPVDADDSIEGFMYFRAVLMNPANHKTITDRLAAYALQEKGFKAKAEFEKSVMQLLNTFSVGGYDKVADAIEANVPEENRQMAATAYLKMIGMAGFEAYNMALEQQGEAALPRDGKSETLIVDSLSAYSDLFYFGSPHFFQLQDYSLVQMSGLQLTKSPGQFWVYLGSCLLVLGIFAMFYIKERRIWLLLKPAHNQVRFAMSSNRKNLDFDEEFDLYKEQLNQLIV